MSSEGKNAIAWRKLFQRYNIFEKVTRDGCCYITTEQIKEYREPRLMAKFDHSINLPDIFAKNELSILPVSRSEYVIARVKAYQKFPRVAKDIIHMSLPDEVQSVDLNNISSETIALNCAYSSGILSDFLDEECLYPTVAGRMRSGKFSYNVNCIGTHEVLPVDVCNSQIEIDAAYEGINSLALLEAKRDISEDFLVRQLYYPYRTWKEKMTKKVRPVFLVYTNGIFNLYEYQFIDPTNYNSLVLIQQKNYSLEDISIRNEDIQNVVEKIALKNSAY